MPNKSNRSRAARRIQAATDLSYQQALALLAPGLPVPELVDDADVAAFLASRRPSPAPDGPDAGRCGSCRVEHHDVCSLTPGCSCCEQTMAADGPGEERSVRGVYWYVESGEGEPLSGHYTDLEEADAEARRLRERLIEVETEDGDHIDDSLVWDYHVDPYGPEGVPDVVISRYCRFCHREAGADYHIAGVIDPGENNVVCAGCWDPRLS